MDGQIVMRPYIKRLPSIIIFIEKINIIYLKNNISMRAIVCSVIRVTIYPELALQNYIEIIHRSVTFYL
jgi:hypothetical protein